MAQERELNAEIMNTLKIPRDQRILMTELSGFRLGMSPRKVKQVVKENNLKGSRYNRETLDDIIVRNDIEENMKKSIIFEKGTDTILLLSDDITITLNFCWGGVSEISMNHYLPKNKINIYERRDRNMFPAMEFTDKTEYLLFAANYDPVKSMSGWIRYYDKGYKGFKGEELFERSIRIYDGLRCLKEGLRKILFDT